MSKKVVEEIKEIGVGTYVFKKPTKVDGEEVKEVNYDLTSLNGSAIRRVKGNLQRKGYTVAVKELDEVFHTALFAECVGWTIDNVESLSAVDYMNIADIVRDFLTAED